MNQAQAETAVTASALVVGGIYVFRRLSESDTVISNKKAQQLFGVGPVLPAGPFVVGWGFTFLVISLMAQASPQLGGTFAILVATGAVLGNGGAAFADLNNKLGSGVSTTRGSAAAKDSPAALPNTYPYAIRLQGYPH